MEEKFLRKIEYDKIIAQLATHTSFAISREKALSLLPASSAHEAGQRLAVTDEARSLIRQYPLFSLGGLWDVRPALHHAQIGGILPPEDLVNLASVCRAARTGKVFFSELPAQWPLLSGLGRSLVFVRTVETAVERAIGPDLSINDNASERLAGIRRKKAAKAEQVRGRLDGFIRNANTARYLQDPIVTMREGRFVIPVKQEFRGQIAGVAHDMSGSGATIFVEPLAVMELNNDIATLVHEEEEEIAAILRALSLVVVNFSTEISADLTILAELDFALAKGKLSYDLDGAAPKINENGAFRLVKARHPLIPAAKVVPVDLFLSRETAALIVTGPNTGGKTVTLKTIGLLTCMGLAGLHIPAEAESEIAFFDAVWADIGDEQSIEQSLSTFSAHMSNIVEILSRANEKSLILFDELGAGTDPTEGAALAMAILKYAQKLGAKTVATTHYSELKAFAYSTPGFLNASMEFDVATLSPTYRLQMGLPGKSNAFEISRRLGLPEEIITTAAESLSTEDVAVAAMLSNLEEMRRELQREKERARVFAASSAEREKRLLAQERKLAAEETDVLRKANLEAQRVIDETVEKSRALLEEQQQRLAEKQNNQRVWQEARRSLKEWRAQLEEEIPEPVFAGAAPSRVKLGDNVFLPKLNQHGTILSLPDSREEVGVQVGVLKLKARLADIRLSDPEKNSKRGAKRGQGITVADMAIRKSTSISATLDLHGYETMEALPLLDKYIDDAFIAGLRTVQINHGRGTGALRRFVHEYLRGHRLVKRFRDGSYEEGGLGVTMVELNI